MKKILISTGGSGGHVIPALNLYDHLKKDFDVKLYTDSRGAKFFPKEIKIKEVGSWGNDYCGINGLHYVALGKKIEK